MKIKVIHCGKVAQQTFLPIVQDYMKRTSAFYKLENIELRHDFAHRDKRANKLSSDPIVKPTLGEYLVFLDERGLELTSKEVSIRIGKLTDDPRIKLLTFVVGPPYGFDDVSKSTANEIWSLSKLTIPSDFAWLLLWEQIYRGVTILKGIPYHHD